MKKTLTIAAVVLTCIGVGLLGNALAADALFVEGVPWETPRAQDRSIPPDTLFVPLRSQHVRLESSSTERMAALEGQPVATNTPAPVFEATNTPAPPVEVQPTNTPVPLEASQGETILRRVPSSLQVSEAAREAASGPPGVDAQIEGPAPGSHYAEMLRQADVHFDVAPPAGNLSPGSISAEVCQNQLLNPQMDVVELGDGTGTIEHWSILAQKIYYDNRAGYYRSPSYSLVMVDELDGSDTDLISSTLDYDSFGQGFDAPSSLTSLEISYSRLYSNTNDTDDAWYTLWTLDSEGALDEPIATWLIGTSPTGWSDRTGTLSSSGLVTASGKSLALLFNLASDRTAPGEIIWIDDVQVETCYERGPVAIYLPFIIKQPPPPDQAVCVPVEPDSVTRPGTTVVGATCGGAFGVTDTRDYYSLDPDGVSEVRLRLFDLPSGTNWDAIIYEDAAGYPYVCHIGTPGAADKHVDCTLNPSKSYLILVNAGTAPSETKTYKMAVESREAPTPTPTATPGTSGIHGQVTLNNAAVSGVSLNLRYYNGSSWSTRASDTTDGSGAYRFTGVPSLGSGEIYYVRYDNPSGTMNGRLWVWYGSSITSYTSGTNVHGGDFDIKDITLQSPSNGSSVTLPYTFRWNKRGIASDDHYRFYLHDPIQSSTVYLDLGDVSEVTLGGLPGGWPSGRTYYWWIAVCQDGGCNAYGYSYETRSVTINVSSSATESSEQWSAPLSLSDTSRMEERTP